MITANDILKALEDLKVKVELFAGITPLPHNPIIDNRIVSDITFALRLKSFISNTKVNDPMSEEEQEYLLKVAEDLIKYQVSTCKDDAELKYLEYNSPL